MAIMGFIIVVAGRAFADSTGMRVRSQNMLASAEEVGRVSALLKEDISQLGAKSWGISSASGYVFDSAAYVHMSYSNDLSSYYLGRSSGSSYDSLYFRKVHYDEDGKCKGVMAIELYVQDSVLFRKCTPSSFSKCSTPGLLAAECPEAPVEMARGVSEFAFLPSKPDDTLLIAQSNPAFGSSGNILSGFPPDASPMNFYFTSNGTGCHSISFKKDEEYAIELRLPYSEPESGKINYMDMFQAGRDHLSIGLRYITPSTVSVPDFLFYPPQAQEANKVTIRHFEFSVPSDITACIGITAAFSADSPARSGWLRISNIKVSKQTDKAYRFDREDPDYNPVHNPPITTPPTPDRASVKAFELTLGINKRGEINRAITVIPIPNNGITAADEQFAGGS